MGQHLQIQLVVLFSTCSGVLKVAATASLCLVPWSLFQSGINWPQPHTTLHTALAQDLAFNGRLAEPVLKRACSDPAK